MYAMLVVWILLMNVVATGCQDSPEAVIGAKDKHGRSGKDLVMFPLTVDLVFTEQPLTGCIQSWKTWKS